MAAKLYSIDSFQKLVRGMVKEAVQDFSNSGKNKHINIVVNDIGYELAQTDVRTTEGLLAAEKLLVRLQKAISAVKSEGV